MGDWGVAVTLGLMGAFVGSFVALVARRWPAGRAFLLGRSACESCGAKLSPFALIPVLSYMALRGRCGRCGAPIGWREPAIELAAAGVGLWAGLMGQGVEAAILAGLGWWLLLIAVIDAEQFWLPDALTLPLLAAGLIEAGARAPGELADRAIGAAAGFLSLAAIAFAYRRLRGREGLGGGDPRLYAACGAWVGWAGLPSVMVWACLAAFSVIVARMAMGGAVRGNDALPLGTFLAIGLWLTALHGPLGL